jgi:hypothetical protein
MAVIIVANVVGTPCSIILTEMSIGDAMVQIGQKNCWLTVKETGVIS